jgi:hypothetical protein
VNKERLVFKVTDGVKTPEEVTTWEGGAHVSGNLLFHPILKHLKSLYWDFTRVDPSWSLLGAT